jgi:hypothetical protein
MELVRVANNGLPELDLRYYNLKLEVDSFQTKRDSLDRQITALGKTFDVYYLRCEQEGVVLLCSCEAKDMPSPVIESLIKMKLGTLF